MSEDIHYLGNSKKGYVYLMSAPMNHVKNIVKIGLTTQPHSRIRTLLTGCVPDMNPSQDIVYVGIWETTATNSDELYSYEEVIHNRFRKLRKIRERIGDSEWFDFRDTNPYETVKKFLSECSWVVCEITLEEIHVPVRKTSFFNINYCKNIHFQRNKPSRDKLLNALQEPVIVSIQKFIADTLTEAGYVTAPCGSGKTMMTVKSMVGLTRCIICCPSNRIQEQWKDTILSQGVFRCKQVHLIGESGTTNLDTIGAIFQGDSYCIISTYASSHLLVGAIRKNTELIVFDEAHHMAGVICKDEDGEGRTRRLMMKATEFAIKPEPIDELVKDLVKKLVINEPVVEAPLEKPSDSESVHEMLLNIIQQQKQKEEKNDIWKHSPYKDLVKLQSNNVGNVGEKLINAICKSTGIPADCDGSKTKAVGGGEGDGKVMGIPVEIKTAHQGSTMPSFQHELGEVPWKGSEYMIFVDISPDCIYLTIFKNFDEATYKSKEKLPCFPTKTITWRKEKGAFKLDTSVKINERNIENRHTLKITPTTPNEVVASFIRKVIVTQTVLQ